MYTRATTTYWQNLLDDWPDGAAPRPPYRFEYPVRLADGRVLVLPLRALPDGRHAVASLIANQAAFSVITALADAMTGLASGAGADVVVGMPTLGLMFAPYVAHGLGHERFVPLGYSRKFWYDDALSEPISSVTTPTADKRLYVDPHMLPLLERRRICLVDDAVSTGSSLLACHRLFARCGLTMSSIVVAMKQTTRWQVALADASPALRDSVRAVFGCPLFAHSSDGWVPVAGTQPAIP